MNKLEEQLYLEKVILNSIDRSLGRYNAILEYVKKNAYLKYWKQAKTKKQQIWVFVKLKIGIRSYKKYHQVINYQEGQDTNQKQTKAFAKLAEQIFRDY